MSKVTDKVIRAMLKRKWEEIKADACCGGKGLVVGCPVCGKVWK